MPEAERGTKNTPKLLAEVLPAALSHTELGGGRGDRSWLSPTQDWGPSLSPQEHRAHPPGVLGSRSSTEGM